MVLQDASTANGLTHWYSGGGFREGSAINSLAPVKWIFANPMLA